MFGNLEFVLNLSNTQGFENRCAITQGECMGDRSAYLRFVERERWRLCLHHLRHQSLRAKTKFQQLVF